MIEGPPALTSERYATDFNQVKAWGAVNSTVRSAEQTLISNQWAGVGTTTQHQLRVEQRDRRRGAQPAAGAARNWPAAMRCST